MPGPRAVRSMRAPREDVSVLKGVTVMIGLAMDHENNQEDRYWPTGNSCEGVVGVWRVKAGMMRCSSLGRELQKVDEFACCGVQRPTIGLNLLLRILGARNLEQSKFVMPRGRRELVTFLVDVGSDA